MDGALMEVGPYRVNKDGKLRLQDGSWDEFANVLFVDQPLGTGFSYVDTNSYVHEMDQMAENMIHFLKEFFAIFPEYRHTEVRQMEWMSRRSGHTDLCNSCTSRESRTPDNGYLTSRTQSSSTTRKTKRTLGNLRAS